MVSLESIQQYCKGKKIIIVGNSSGLLQSNHGELIDAYDIVVRINSGYLQTQDYKDSIGSKTNILSMGIKSADRVGNIVKDNRVDYILSPIIWSDKLSYFNSYNIDPSIYHTLKSNLGSTKPSTGISTYNFFNRYINFNKLDLIGFDFFESSARQRNQLGHCYVKDHHGIKESKFFESSKDPEKTILHPIHGSNTAIINNLPEYSQLNLIVKNNNRK